jgi:hypothetical protein
MEKGGAAVAGRELFLFSVRFPSLGTPALRKWRGVKTLLAIGENSDFPLDKKPQLPWAWGPDRAEVQKRDPWKNAP